MYHDINLCAFVKTCFLLITLLPFCMLTHMYSPLSCKSYLQCFCSLTLSTVQVHPLWHNTCIHLSQMHSLDVTDDAFMVKGHTDRIILARILISCSYLRYSRDESCMTERRKREREREREGERERRRGTTRRVGGGKRNRDDATGRCTWMKLKESV